MPHNGTQLSSVLFLCLLALFNMKTTDIVLIATTTITGLMAGLFFAFSYSVTGGLGKLADAEYIRAFQSINREIQNPLFLACFMGILLLLPVSTYLHYSNPAVFKLLLAATIIYFGGAFAVTALGNIPLNNAIDAFNIDTATAEQISAQRTAFETRWNNLNLIRVVSSTLSLLLMILACIKKT